MPGKHGCHPVRFDFDSLAKSIALGYRVHRIPQSEFNYGATRQLALTLCPDADIFIYMTQDAILASPDSIANLLHPFADEKVGAVCGRQLPHADASPLAFHARTFNYASVSVDQIPGGRGKARH